MRPTNWRAALIPDPGCYGIGIEFVIQQIKKRQLAYKFILIQVVHFARYIQFSPDNCKLSKVPGGISGCISNATQGCGATLPEYP